ncbi:hypothetical protein ABZ402_49965 [Streptomyces mirabilis]|uniref:hypothetical protein n=1 Tax=Streptomyces mirabilis TaxID=68239 RepID=UPI0033CCE865
MDTQRVCYYAYFTNPDATESEEDELEMLVETWSDDGVALVLDEEGLALCGAHSRTPCMTRFIRFSARRGTG